MLEKFCDTLVYSALGFQPGSRLGEAVDFFIYDSVKILLLLYVMIAVVGVLRTYLPARRVKAFLGGRNRLFSYLAASSFGALTPFCSCSSIPIFMSFIKAGVPIGPAFSFLVTSPLINEYLAVLMLGFFGFKVTAAYIAFGMLLGVSAGFLMDRMKVERYLVEDFKTAGNGETEMSYGNFRRRIAYGLGESSGIVGKLWKWVLLGVGVGALIHGFIPEEAIQGILDATGVLSVPLAVLAGVPIYANCSAVIPIALALFQKGVPLGTALAFMMSTAALSLPEAVILRRVMKLPLIILFFGTVATGIVLVGYAFNTLPRF